MRIFKVRPSSSSKPKEAFRVNISAASLLALKLRPGTLCQLKHMGDGEERTSPAIAWTSNDRLGDNLAQISDTLKDISGLRNGDQITISKAEGSIEDVARVTLRHTVIRDSVDEETRSSWERQLALTLPSLHEIIGVGQHVRLMVDPVSGPEQAVQHDFIVLDVGMPSAGIAKIPVTGEVSIVAALPNQPPNLILDSSGLGGMQMQLKRVQGVLSGFNASKDVCPPPWVRPTQGILVYGPKGTGKSILVRAIEKCSWAKVLRWSPGSPSPKITQFPALVIVQGLEGTAMSSSDRDMKHVSAVEEFFDGIHGRRVLVVAEVRHPNNVHEALRGFLRFRVEVELPIPNVVQRGDILKVIRAEARIPGDPLLTQMAESTHGYVGADLVELLHVAWENALERRDLLKMCTNGVQPSKNPSIHAASQSDQNGNADDRIQSPPAFEITIEDLDNALLNCRPSVLQTIILETPDVHWSDIGGQHEIKKRLQNAVERPLKQAERMRKLNSKPTKGVLLYGPPGCSKTLLVKALAREAGLNFLAVKGAELISMYVGESERAIREIFRKARAASPSIIFFDEIDSIATNRKSELNVLTTLLNEMDGFEELKNVFVVAATNKPQAIDPALLRPGRIDDAVFIGLPDSDTRKEILQNWFNRSTVVGVDVAELAGMPTEGFSGAETVGICQTASIYAMDEDRDYISDDDLRKAIRNTPKSVTEDMLQEYVRWNATRG